MSDIVSPSSNPFEWLLRTLFIIFTSVGLGLSVMPSSPTTGEPAPTHINHVIENVEAVVRESFPMGVSITVTGYQPDSCEYPVQVTQSREGNTIYVEIFREVPANVRCASSVVPYNETIQLEGEFVNENYVVMVNDYTLPLNFAVSDGSQTVLQPVTITTVEVGKYPSVAAYPAALYVSVVGGHDGCDFPITIQQRREGNTVYVDILREVDIAALCPMVFVEYKAEIQLEGGFEQGTYTINVNGVVVEYVN